MKKHLVTVGMIFVMAAPAFAAGTKMTLQETMKDYSKQVKESAFGKGVTSAKTLAETSQKKTQDQLINMLKLNGTEANRLSMSLNMESANRAERLDALASIIAVKEMVRAGSIGDAAEAKSLDSASTAVAQLLSSARLVGKANVETVKDLNATELAETSTALKKMITLPESILLDFNLKERDSATNVINRYNEINARSGKSVEENFVQAIMEVQGLTKEKAMELVRRIKECV